MKKSRYISAFAMCLIVGSTVFSQTFSPSDLKIISQKADSLLSRYGTYSSFTKDAMTIDQSYIDGFKGLFKYPDEEITNDLDPKDETPRSVTITQYINYVKAWYSAGIGVDIRVTEKKPPVVKDNLGSMDIYFEKSLLGFYKDQTEYRKKVNLVMTMVFDTKLKSFSIGTVVDPEFRASHQEMKKQYAMSVENGDNYIKIRNYEKALAAYQQALLFKPGDSYATSKIKICQSYLEQVKASNRKPAYLNVHLLPALTNAKLTGTSGTETPSSSSVFAFGGGLGFEYALTKSDKGMLLIGAALDYMPYKSKITMSNYLDTINTTDKDGDKVKLINSLNNITENLSLSMFEIPIYVSYRFLLSKSAFLYLKAGLKLGFLIGKKYTSTASGDYKGQYAQYSNIILYDLPTYGYGNYPSVTSKTSTTTLSGMDLSGFGGVGFGFNVSNSVSLHLGVNYTYGFSSLSGGGNSNYKLSKDNTDIQSMTGLGKVKTSALAFEIGVNFKLTK